MVYAKWEKNLDLSYHIAADLPEDVFRKLVDTDPHGGFGKLFSEAFKKGIPLWEQKDRLYRKVIVMLNEREKGVGVTLSTPQLNILWRYLANYHTQFALPTMLFSGMRNAAHDEYMAIEKESPKGKFTELKCLEGTHERLVSAMKKYAEKHNYPTDIIEPWQFNKILEGVPIVLQGSGEEKI